MTDTRTQIQHTRSTAPASGAYADRLFFLVGAELTRFAVTWGARKEGSAEQILAIYLEGLDGVALESIPAAGRELRRTSRFFPTVAEFREAIERVEDQARRAATRARPLLPAARDVCHQCQTPFTWRNYRRADETSYERFLCDCQAEAHERGLSIVRTPPSEPTRDPLMRTPRSPRRMATAADVAPGVVADAGSGRGHA